MDELLPTLRALRGTFAFVGTILPNFITFGIKRKRQVPNNQPWLLFLPILSFLTDSLF